MLHKHLPLACVTYDGFGIFAPFFINVCSSMSGHTLTSAGVAHASVNKLIVGDYCFFFFFFHLASVSGCVCSCLCACEEK